VTKRERDIKNEKKFRGEKKHEKTPTVLEFLEGNLCGVVNKVSGEILRGISISFVYGTGTLYYCDI